MVLRINVFDSVAVKDVILAVEIRCQSSSFGFCPSPATPYALRVSTVYANAPNVRLSFTIAAPASVGVF